ncbi:MAG TPA: hypothetical protein VK688_04130 [Gemmatimonadales bacterium]|jgi:hypothetical protein|nr:hypothetical protein [Gemmatimonadales bacterium]
MSAAALKCRDWIFATHGSRVGVYVTGLIGLLLAGVFATTSEGCR